MQDSMFSLAGKIALVTGGGRGIGAGIASALAQAGADVLIADYTQQLADTGAAAIAALQRQTLALQLDVKDPASVAAMLAAVEEKFGRLDIAVNNAGVLGVGAIEELTVEQWNEVMDVNLRGVFLCCQAEIRLMKKAKFGRIINVSSIAGKVGFPYLSHYSASKFGVIGLTNAAAKEVAKDGITVNALCPGIVATGMWRGEKGLSALWAQPGETEEQSWQRHQKVFLPQGVAQTPQDMGQMVVYLAAAEHVTGQALAVDGGFSL